MGDPLPLMSSRQTSSHAAHYVRDRLMRADSARRSSSRLFSVPCQPLRSLLLRGRSLLYPQTLKRMRTIRILYFRARTIVLLSCRGDKLSGKKVKSAGYEDIRREQRENYRPSAFSTAGCAGCPSRVVTPSSHAFNSSGRCASSAFAAAWTSSCLSSTRVITAFSSATSNFSWL